MSNFPQLLSYSLGDGVTAFSTTRHGGAGTDAYAGFNINPFCGDAPEAVANNRRALCSLLAIDDNHLLMPHQTHGVESRIIGEDYFSLPTSVQKMILEGVDCIMTQCKGVCIGVSTADCIPLLMHDTKRHAICAVHAGWRGTVARIAQKAVVDMRMAFQTDPADIRIAIGPGISLDTFEVGDEVYKAFEQAAFDMKAISRRQEKWHIDLPLCNSLQLQSMGIPAENITLSNVCTYTQCDDFFSARRLSINSGRIYNGILLL